MTQQAQVVGTVEYREGDGPALRIRKGPVHVDKTPLDVTLSWEDDTGGHEARGRAALPLADYTRYVQEGAIQE